MPEPASLFVPDAAHGVSGGETWWPTELARGPWDPDALHGGPVAALLARAVERTASIDAATATGTVTAVHMARLSVELLRPVPVAPLAVTAGVTRPGRKVQVVEAEMTAGHRVVARCRALRLRLAPSEDEPGGTAGAPADGSAGPGPVTAPFAGPQQAGERRTFASAYRGFHNAGAELRFARGRVDEPGAAAVWVRLAVPVTPGEEPSPLQRTVAAADFGNGVSAVLPFDRFTFINPDLTVFCSRPARGEWIGLDAETTLGPPGVGVAHSVLWDTGAGGPFGRAVQCLVVEPR